MSALLTLQLAGTGLPTALAQETGGNPNTDGLPAEEMAPDEVAQVSTPGPQENKSTSRQTDTPATTTPRGQGTPSQEEGEMGEEGSAAKDMVGAMPLATMGAQGSAPLTTEGAPLETQDTQVSVTYVDENDSPSTAGRGHRHQACGGAGRRPPRPLRRREAHRE